MSIPPLLSWVWAVADGRTPSAARRTLVPSSHASLSKGSQRLTVNNLLHRAGLPALLLNANYILERLVR